MNILITGAKGFIGKNLTVALKQHEAYQVFEYGHDTDAELLEEYCSNADFVFHLAGINRPQHEEEFMDGNFGFMSVLLDTLKKHKNNCPIMFASSIQAAADNPYGKSKKAAENLLFTYAKTTCTPVYIYRFPNVFGKWCQPNYNSVVATFCYNIAHDIPIKINNKQTILNLVYIDDILDEMFLALEKKPHKTQDGYCLVPTTYTISLGELAELIRSFRESRSNILVPDMADDFTRKLYSTYLSYLPEKQFPYPLVMHEDTRGSFTEILRTLDRGQFSVNISKPGIMKGNHWHHTKNEKFIVVSGKALIRLRQLYSEQVLEYHVSGDKIEAVDIPPGYTHSITNEGSTDLITFMWCNECFDPDKQDTYFEEV